MTRRAGRTMYDTVNALHVGGALADAVDSIDFMDDETATIGVTGHADERVGTVRYDGTRATLTLHQSVVEEPVTIDPAHPEALAPVSQAPRPDGIAPKIQVAVDSIEDEFDVICWDFVEISAGSMASGGHFTDFEFEWVITGI